MAEIRVEQKRRSMAWLWLLLVLALVAAAVWYFYFNGGTLAGPDTGALGAPEVQVSDLAPGAPALDAPAARAA